MSKMIRSARGEMVNFDLILIKQEIAASAAPLNVSSREDFIENRIRRRGRRAGSVGQKPTEREMGEEVNAKTLEETITTANEESALEQVESEVAESEPNTTRKIKR